MDTRYYCIDNGKIELHQKSWQWSTSIVGSITNTTDELNLFGCKDIEDSSLWRDSDQYNLYISSRDAVKYIDRISAVAEHSATFRGVTWIFTPVTKKVAVQIKDAPVTSFVREFESPLGGEGDSRKVVLAHTESVKDWANRHEISEQRAWEFKLAQ